MWSICYHNIFSLGRVQKDTVIAIFGTVTVIFAVTDIFSFVYYYFYSLMFLFILNEISWNFYTIGPTTS